MVWYNAGRSVKTEYLLNTNASPLKCIKYGVNSTGGLTGNSTTFYTSGELSVVKTTDEDLNVSYSFTDKQGHTVLTRQMNNSEEHDTYYIYNDKGNLCFVLQPKYQESADLGKYAFQYEYDACGRCTKKKLPGADFVEYTYNAADQLVFSQDGNQRAQATKKWTYYLYDKFGRLTEQGECTNKSATSSPVVYIHNYYDGYGFINGTGFTDSNYKLTEAQKAYGKGYQTGSVISIFGDSKKIYLMYQYDIQGRVVKTVQNNLLDGLDVTETTYTFSGNPQTVVHKNTYKENGTQKSITETYTYTYDYADRISKVEHKLNDTKVVLSENTYNKLGQLVNRTLHGASADIMGYTYNIRSWLTRIESPNLILKLNYGYSAGGGNIASMFWKSGEEGRQKYTFTYDGLGRMLNADHLILGQQDDDDDDWGVTTGLMSTRTDRQIEETPLARENAFTERVKKYDKNGNILELVRYGQTGANSYGVIDNLTMKLTGNQLNRVDDASTASAYGGGFEFKDAVKQDNEYAYDANGNLTQDLNKGIEDIQYNCLNLPRLIKFKDQSTITYTYAADGTKLRVEHKIGSSTTQTTYCSNVIYEGGTAKCLLTEEGYVSLDDREYHYYLKDHQGNNRVLVNKNGGVEEINHYYPFGGVFASEENVQPYKYNGKELDAKKGLNWYDYGARQYDAALGRFITTDPLAEKYYSWNPYAYCSSNPVNAIDYQGKLVIFINGMHWGDGKSNRYWDKNGGGFATAVMKHLNDYNAMYIDGSIGGVGQLPYNLDANLRRTFGRNQGFLDAPVILRKIKNSKGELIETIKIITHSMGAAYAKGYIEALKQFLIDNNLPLSLIEFEADFAPFQPTEQEAVKGIKTFQFTNMNDDIANNKWLKSPFGIIQGVEKVIIGIEENKKHTIKDFYNMVFKLPEGKYEVIDGKIIPIN